MSKITSVGLTRYCTAIFDNFRIWSQISPEQFHTTKIGKALDQLQSLPYWTHIWWTLVN